MSSDGRGWEDLFWLVFERSSNPIALVDSERRFVDANEAFVKMLGMTRGGLIGRATTTTIVDRERPESTDSWREFVRRGEDSGMRTLIRGDGSECEVEYARRMTSVGGRRLAVYVVTSQLEKGRFERPGPAGPDALTQRERDVVTQIALGETTDGIAKALHISPETVRTHVRNAMRKLNVHTRAQLVAAFLCFSLPHME